MTENGQSKFIFNLTIIQKKNVKKNEENRI